MPTIGTRQFLRLFRDSFPSIPMFALVDADPYGETHKNCASFGISLCSAYVS